jgi:hypothetical protein
MDTKTHMHSQAESLLAEFDAAVEKGTASICGESAEWVALVQHVWGRTPTPVEWRQWISIMRAAGRDDVCYRA